MKGVLNRLAASGVHPDQLELCIDGGDRGWFVVLDTSEERV